MIFVYLGVMYSGEMMFVVLFITGQVEKYA